MNQRDLIQKALQWRYATKRFDPAKKISADDWTQLEDSLHLAPSSYGLQPWKFLIIRNPELRKELKAVSWNQGQITDASHMVVFLYRKKMEEKDIDQYISRVAQVRGGTVESMKDYRNMMVGDVVTGPRAAKIDIWTQRQAYIAMGFLLETAALLGVDACPMEGIDSAAYDKILGLENSGWSTVAVVTLGYRHAEDYLQGLKKVRFDKKTIIEYRD